MELGKLTLVLGCSFMVLACSGRDLGPAPVISDLTLQSPVASDTTRVEGTVLVKDPLGLTTLMLSLTVNGPGPTEALPPFAIDSTVEGQLVATVAFNLRSTHAFQSGTYQLVVTLTEDGTPSNSLTSTLVVQ
jgi:hypothetical protein